MRLERRESSMNTSTSSPSTKAGTATDKPPATLGGAYRFFTPLIFMAELHML
jgi:hypothetical protein